MQHKNVYKIVYGNASAHLLPMVIMQLATQHTRAGARNNTASSSVYIQKVQLLAYT